MMSKQSQVKSETQKKDNMLSLAELLIKIERRTGVVSNLIAQEGEKNES